MDKDLEDVLTRSKEAVSRAGRDLASLGVDLSSGKVQRAVDKYLDAAANFKDVEETANAINDVREDRLERQTAEAVEEVLITMAETIIKAAIAAAI